MSNLDIRGEIRAAGFTQWKIAEAMEISESVLCRKLRHELPEEEKNKIRAIIKELAKK
ncbi:MAG TPA: hypothetical protein PKD52_11125 [Clostridiales bacterium]|nr:hypothetical protein [Clostridiales bacterium]